MKHSGIEWLQVTEAGKIMIIIIDFGILCQLIHKTDCHTQSIPKIPKVLFLFYNKIYFSDNYLH